MKSERDTAVVRLASDNSAIRSVVLVPLRGDVIDHIVSGVNVGAGICQVRRGIVSVLERWRRSKTTVRGRRRLWDQGGLVETQGVGALGSTYPNLTDENRWYVWYVCIRKM